MEILKRSNSRRLRVILEKYLLKFKSLRKSNNNLLYSGMKAVANQNNHSLRIKLVNSRKIHLLSVIRAAVNKPKKNKSLKI